MSQQSAFRLEQGRRNRLDIPHGYHHAQRDKRFGLQRRSAKLPKMCLPIRTLMIWLLLAALPVQSWAVATMVNCGPSHHRMTLPAVEVTADTYHGDSHGEHAQAGNDHGSHHHDMATDDGHADQSQADTDPQSLSLSMGKFKCSACATCCLGMALPSSVLTFDASVSSDAVEPGIPQCHVVFLTAGVERPPRIFLT
jgi:hypothetical protein